MFAFKSLQQRLIVLLVVPVTLFLLVIGVFGYRFIQGLLFKDWQEIAILRLERATHQLDMRLHGIMQWMEMFARAGQDPQGKEVQRWLLGQIKAQPGVREVYLTWKQTPQTKGRKAVPPQSVEISIEYFYPSDAKTVGLRGELLDQTGQDLGRLELLVSYDYLMQDILTEGWMVAQMACLVNQEGLYLAHSSAAMQTRHCVGEAQDPLELVMLKAMKEKDYGTVMGEGYSPEMVIGFYKLHAAPWTIMLHARGSEILAPILRFRLYYLAGGILCLIVILVFIRLGVRPVVVAIRKIAAKAGRVAQANYGKPLPVASRDEIGQLTLSFNDMVAGLKERDFISNTFGRYVDPEIARDLLSRPEASRMGGEKREVVILFSDIRGFTPLAETLSPEATIHLLNRHFAKMIEVIQAHGGIIVDFLGDAILAFFDPLEGPIEPVVRRAIGCALKMQAAVEAENLAEPGLPPLNIGIGLHAGEVVVGNLGSESRAKYGIIGAAVNLTHRIQGQAQGREVVVSEMVFHHSEETVAVIRTFETRLKGIAHPVMLYVVESMREEP
ncbi:MAG: adenylate/guanylate cyclase domain-containing protein [Syntrophobacterales bacterium]|jgi:class 3 adenylate cyclase|nr:adenylate/guanylate cyclase domain-containing protein [Syntrophobacterales bacterium]